jgi:hypothetical protein
LQLLREVGHGGRQDLDDVVGPGAREMEQHHIPAGPLHQRADVALGGESARELLAAIAQNEDERW